MKKISFILLALTAFASAFAFSFSKPPPEELREQVRWFIKEAGVSVDGVVEIKVDEQWFTINAVTGTIWEKDDFSGYSFSGYRITFGKVVEFILPQYRWFIIAHEVSHILQFHSVHKEIKSFTYFLETADKKKIELEADAMAGRLICRVFGKEGLSLLEGGLYVVCAGGLACVEGEVYSRFSTRLKVAISSCVGE